MPWMEKDASFAFWTTLSTLSSSGLSSVSFALPSQSGLRPGFLLRVASKSQNSQKQLHEPPGSLGGSFPGGASTSRWHPLFVAHCLVAPSIFWLELRPLDLDHITLQQTPWAMGLHDLQKRVPPNGGSSRQSCAPLVINPSLSNPQQSSHIPLQTNLKH